MLVKSLVAALLLAGVSSSCFAYSDEIEWLRKQSFNSCKKFYVWRLVDDYVSNAKWESGLTNDGETIVNVRGKIAYKNRPANVVLQFTIEPKARKFNMSGFSINGDVQSKEMRVALINNMCSSVGG